MKAKTDDVLIKPITVVTEFLLDNGFSKNNTDKPKPYTYTLHGPEDSPVLLATKDSDYFDSCFSFEYCGKLGGMYRIYVPCDKETLVYKGFSNEELLKDLEEIVFN